MRNPPLWPLDPYENPHSRHEYNVHMSSENYKESGFAKHLVLIVCFIFQEKWDSWRKEPFKIHFLLTDYNLNFITAVAASARHMIMSSLQSREREQLNGRIMIQ